MAILVSRQVEFRAEKTARKRGTLNNNKGSAARGHISQRVRAKRQNCEVCEAKAD